jgi:hypothetical protein
MRAVLVPSVTINAPPVRVARIGPYDVDAVRQACEVGDVSVVPLETTPVKACGSSSLSVPRRPVRGLGAFDPAR